MNVSKIDILKEVRAYKKYLTLTNFKQSIVTMYCLTLNLFYNFCNARFPDEDLSQEHT